MKKDSFKYPRILTDFDLSHGASVTLDGDQHHYLRNVLRKNNGDYIRLFNARDGEWFGEITDMHKKHVTFDLREQIRPQPEQKGKLSLYFAPIKKQRLEVMIEKAVELGVSDFIPVITEFTENRKWNEDKLQAYCIAAAQQSERLDLPRLHAAVNFAQFIALQSKHDAPFYIALERFDARPVHDLDITRPCGFFIGPEGGFSEEEKAACADLADGNENICIINLGENVLRSETASLFCLSQVRG